METKKVLLGMSGGVDSSVYALLLKQKGYSLIGATLELCSHSDSTYIDAKNICKSMDIPYFVFDLSLIHI